MSAARRPRLVLVNGMPGAGKSTLAARYRDEHPGVLCADADDLRPWIGGDPAADPNRAEAVRVLSLAMAGAHLARGHDVVVPQLLARIDEVERYAATATSAGAVLVEVMLHGRVVEARVPDEALDELVGYAHGLADVVARRPATHRVVADPDDPGAAYRSLCDLLG